MVSVSFVTQLLSALSVIGEVLILIFALGFLVNFLLKKENKFYRGMKDFVKENAVLLSFIVSVFATGGSLFYSEIAGYTPCALCWFQRIFMYPLVLMFGIALWKKDKRVFRYALPMAIIGALIAAYHYFVQVSTYAVTCLSNSDVPCTVKYTFTFGYITIPMMALTAFVLIIVAGLVVKRKF